MSDFKYYTSFEYAALEPDASVEEIVRANRINNDKLHEMGYNAYAVCNLENDFSDVRALLRNKKVNHDEAMTRMKNVYLAYLRSCGKYNHYNFLLSFAKVIVTVKLHDLNRWRQFLKHILNAFQISNGDGGDPKIFKKIYDGLDHIWWEWCGANLAYEKLCIEYGYRWISIEMRASTIIAKPQYASPTIKKSSASRVIPLACVRNLRSRKSNTELACASSLRSRRTNR
jgi:hypothetical protein